MTLILDTSVVIDIERRNEEIINKLKSLSNEHPNIPSISLMTYAELLIGFNKGKIKDSIKEKEILDKFNFLSATKKTAEELAELKYNYDKKGMTLSLADLFIASQAIENNMTLITKDSDFNKIEELDKIII
jgi:predicted nucleic acid-binding protein